MFEIYASYKIVFWILAIILPVLGCVIHYRLFGPHGSDIEQTKQAKTVIRFRKREWVLHWVVLIGFVVLVLTGIAQIFPGNENSHLGEFHGWLGFILFLITIFTLLGWLKEALFTSFDLKWLSKMGGYLSRDAKPLPAGRFNAGQKIYYWFILLLYIAFLVTAINMQQGLHSPEGRQELYWILHGLLACLATILVIGHSYLSLFANPFTARVLRDGRVSKAYTDKYHSRW